MNQDLKLFFRFKNPYSIASDLNWIWIRIRIFGFGVKKILVDLELDKTIIDGFGIGLG